MSQSSSRGVVGTAEPSVMETPQERAVVIFLLDNPALPKFAPASLKNLSRNSQPPLCVSDDPPGQV